ITARLFHDQRTASGLLVIFIEELVAAGLLRTYVDGCVAVAGNHLLETQRLALELHRLGVEISELDHDRRVHGRADLGWIESLVFVTQPDFSGGLRPGCSNTGNRY